MEARAPKLKCLGDRRAPWKFHLGDHLDHLRLGTPYKILGSPEGSLKFSHEHRLAACTYWKYGTLHAIVECGGAFFDDITQGNANFSELPHTLNVYSGNIDVRFVLNTKGTRVCNSSSSVLVLNRTSPSLLHTFVVDTLLNFLFAIQHTGNSCLHQPIPR